MNVEDYHVHHHHADKLLLVITAIIAGFGVLMVYDASAVSAALRYKFANQHYFLTRQFIWYLVGLMGLLAASWFPIGRYRHWILPLLMIVIILLVLVLIPGIGVKVGGARRWLRIGPFSIQPGEFARFTLVVYLAHFLALKKGLLNRFVYGFLPPAIITGAMAGMLAAQPKFSSAVLIVLLAAIIFFVAKIPIAHLVIAATACSPIALLGINHYSYITQRIAAWLNPSEHLKGIAFQSTQGLIAIGSGGIWGVGLGQGRQKMFYLPESHTDFIFAVIAEELGFLGAMLVISGFFFILTRGIHIALTSTDTFSKLLAAGLTASITLPVLLNLMVATGLFPVTGVPLPLISFGGSALVTDMVTLGLLAGLINSSSAPRIINQEEIS